MTHYRLTLKSANKKTGQIPVSTTSNDSCPPSCGLFKSCYAKIGPLALVWNETTQGKFATDLQAFCGKLATLPEGTLWRHNQAGDLPGEGDAIDAHALNELVQANKGKRGFTYSHKPVVDNINNNCAIQSANYHGFTVNLSANNLTHADELASLEIAPVVVLLSSSVQGNVKIKTPGGRRVVVCPATYRNNVNCKSCGLCQIRNRKVIVGFPAHGSQTEAANAVALSL